MELDLSPPRLVLFGVPGAGKGWLAKKLKSRFPQCEHLGTGDLFRGLIAAGDPVGEFARPYMDAGELIPDAIVLEQVGAMLDTGRFTRGFVFDGFPRTAAQARALDALLERRGLRPLDAVLFLDVPHEVAVARLADRLVCTVCAEVFNRAGKPPRVEGVCDACSGALAQRADDDPAVVPGRVAVYRRQLRAVVEVYTARNLLLRLDGTRIGAATVDAVAAAVRARRGGERLPPPPP